MPADDARVSWPALPVLASVFPASLKLTAGCTRPFTMALCGAILKVMAADALGKQPHSPATAALAGGAIGGVLAAALMASGVIPTEILRAIPLLASGGLLGMTWALVARERPFVWHMDRRPWGLLFKVQLCLVAGLIALFPRVEIGLAVWSVLFSLALAVSIWGTLTHGPRIWSFQPPRQPLFWEVARDSLWALALWGADAVFSNSGLKLLAVVYGLTAILELCVYIWGIPSWSKRSWEKLYSVH